MIQDWSSRDLDTLGLFVLSSLVCLSFNRHRRAASPPDITVTFQAGRRKKSKEMKSHAGWIPFLKAYDFHLSLGLQIYFFP